jgi:hypothetical protein
MIANKLKKKVMKTTSPLVSGGLLLFNPDGKGCS